MSECIVWTGATNNRGYGMRSKEGRGHLVHRLAWAEVHGPIPPGMQVNHHCDNPPCYNVEHLFLGTQADNMRDAVAKGRQAEARRTDCPHGHPYIGDNLYVTSDGFRQCRACAAARARRRRALT